MYGPDGKAYAPWMVGKVNEEYTKKGETKMFSFQCMAEFSFGKNSIFTF